MNPKYKLRKLRLSCKKIHLVVLIFLIAGSGCKKFVQINPPTSEIAAATVFSNNTTASAAMTGIYVNMMLNGYNGMSDGYGSIGFLQGLAADELTDYDLVDAPFPQFYTNSLTSSSGGGSNYYYWTELYNELYQVNSAIAGVDGSGSVTAGIKQQILGEAEFMRAFLHFYAVNLYGPVPIVTTTNYLANDVISRSPVPKVYEQIIGDLTDAQAKLSKNFVDAAGVTTSQRTRPNSGAATALLARVYLYTGKWDSAEAAATTLINNTSLYGLDTLNGVFLSNSNEAIWQLQPSVTYFNTYDATLFVLTSAPGSSQFPASLSNNLLNVFEPGDKRDSDWVGIYTPDSINFYHYPYKYKVSDYYNPSLPVTEYLMVLRLAEQYLIRAEAEAQLGNIGGAQSDLNIIRARAGLGPTTANDPTSLLTAILHERQVELFTEWGHRWFDLIRSTGSVNINAVMGSPGNVCQQKGGTWNTDWELLPLPLLEIQVNPNLKQNPGY
ncbi:MAG TPA: RagB/SusD family nutrient uptake outer membrane protein [Puia sp.]|nr:RagB/SusD family nutrient uptake outer membrane protein [Puia sp.]